MKKHFKWIGGGIFFLVLVVGGIYLYGEYEIKTHKESLLLNLEEERYTDALENCDKILNKEKTDEIVKLKEIIEIYLEAEQLYNEEKYRMSKEKLETIEILYKEYPIVESIDNLRSNAWDRIKINEAIEDIEHLRVEKRYEEAKKILKSIDQTLGDKNQVDKINSLLSKINKEIEEKEKEENDNTKIKDTFINKINSLKAEKAEATRDNYANAELGEVYRNILDQWYLVYADLKAEIEKKLGEEKSKNFRDSEVQWKSALNEKIDELMVSVTGSGAGTIPLGEEIEEYRKHCTELLNKYF